MREDKAKGGLGQEQRSLQAHQVLSLPIPIASTSARPAHSEGAADQQDQVRSRGGRAAKGALSSSPCQEQQATGRAEEGQVTWAAVGKPPARRASEQGRKSLRTVLGVGSAARSSDMQ